MSPSSYNGYGHANFAAEPSSCLGGSPPPTPSNMYAECQQGGSPPRADQCPEAAWPEKSPDPYLNNPGIGCTVAPPAPTIDALDAILQAHDTLVDERRARSKVHSIQLFQIAKLNSELETAREDARKAWQHAEDRAIACDRARKVSAEHDLDNGQLRRQLQQEMSINLEFNQQIENLKLSRLAEIAGLNSKQKVLEEDAHRAWQIVKEGSIRDQHLRKELEAVQKRAIERDLDNDELRRELKSRRVETISVEGFPARFVVDVRL